MKTLDQIGIHFQTDKASQFSRTYAQPHNYLVHLEQFFAPLRDKPIKLLEIGVGGGESIRTWLEYFSKGEVYGVDLVQRTNPWNTPGSVFEQNNNYVFVCGNQGDPEFWSKFIKYCGGDFDIIIDDGSHIAGDIKATFTCLWQHLKSGGLYIVEDLNFDPKSKEWTENFISHIHMGTFSIDSIYFARELCVMRKR